MDLRKFWTCTEPSEEPHPVLGTRCLIWIGARSKKEYGAVVVGEKTLVAHRVAWELAVGPIPKGKLIMHKCDNPPCVNPEHLAVGTQKENIDDMISKGRSKLFTSTKNPNRKLSDEDVKRLMVLYANGMGYTRLSREFKIHPSSVRERIRSVLGNRKRKSHMAKWELEKLESETHEPSSPDAPKGGETK